MNQGKLEVVKQEMTRVNINILGISELKWTAMGEFNSDDCGERSNRGTIPDAFLYFLLASSTMSVQNAQ